MKTFRMHLTRRYAGFVVIALVAGLAVAVGVGVSSCRPDLSHHRRITLQSIETMTSGHIVDYEQRYGEVFVTLGDDHDDAHIYLLEHPNLSASDALDRLKALKATQSSSRLAEQWRSSGASDRAGIIAECISNDFRFLLGKTRPEVVKLLGEPDKDALRGRDTMSWIDGLCYTYAGGPPLSPSTLTPLEGGQTHSVLVVEFDKHDKASRVYTQMIQ